VKRRAFIGGLGALALLPAGRVAATERYAEVLPGRPLAFPRDHGAHPDFRNEWWYLTGWLKTAGGVELGFQVTFFRSKPPFAVGGKSSFAPAQILLAHAAIADPELGRLRHDQRAARPALGMAGAREDTTEAWIDDWRLELRGNAYRTLVAARDFALELECVPPGPPLLQGADGYSRKGPQPGQASYYYSRPQLQVRGRVARGGRYDEVTGTAWLDHEWSSTLMAPEAAGWDWIGINLEAGGTLMAFRMRDRSGGSHYAGGLLMMGDRVTHRYGDGDIRFTPERIWRSPRTGVDYPVGMRVRTGLVQWSIVPLFDDQELDARASTGTVYWEGAVRCMKGGREFGRGYLELTGYWRPLRL